jgi:hypothetical protein
MKLRHLLILPGLLFLNGVSGQADIAGLYDENGLLIVSGDTDPMSIVRAFSPEIKEEAVRMDEGLIIWPVPVADVLHIHYKDGRGNLPFEIVDITGKIVIRGSIVGGNVNMIELDMASKGDHVLRVVDSKGVHAVAFNRAL